MTLTNLTKFFTNPSNVLEGDFSSFVIFKKIECQDGFSFSCQGNGFNYCEPRQNVFDENSFNYTQMEIGFPSKSDKLILEYAETPEKPTKTVYSYVPVEIIEQLIIKHGGLIAD